MILCSIHYKNFSFVSHYYNLKINWESPGMWYRIGINKLYLGDYIPYRNLNYTREIFMMVLHERNIHDGLVFSRYSWVISFTNHLSIFYHIEQLAVLPSSRVTDFRLNWIAVGTTLSMKFRVVLSFCQSKITFYIFYLVDVNICDFDNLEFLEH